VELRNKAAFVGGKDFSCVPMSFLLHFETTVGLYKYNHKDIYYNVII
jgi:hypothetical protein